MDINTLPIEMQYELIDRMEHIDEETILSLEDPRAARYAELRGFKLFLDILPIDDIFELKYGRNNGAIYNDIFEDDDLDKMRILYDRLVRDDIEKRDIVHPSAYGRWIIRDYIEYACPMDVELEVLYEQSTIFNIMLESYKAKARRIFTWATQEILITEM